MKSFDWVRSLKEQRPLIAPSLLAADFARLADEVILLDGGKLIEQGAAGEVLHAPKMPETREFLEFFGVIR